MTDFDATFDAYGDDELAALYDLVYDDYDEDLALYEQFAARGDGASLELCVGSGRVALHLARAGHRVVGIDTSRPMLDRLGTRLDTSESGTTANVRLVEADARDFDLGERFDLVYCALDSFELFLTQEDQLAVLRNVARHLNDGGVFVCELRALSAVDWSPEPQPLQLEWARRDPSNGDLITKMSSLRASHTTQTTTTTLIFDRTRPPDDTIHRRSFEVTLRVTARAELDLLLAAAGMRVQHVYGDTALSPFTDASDTMIVVSGREGS